MEKGDQSAVQKELKNASKLLGKRAQNRLYVSSWLGGLSFAAFAALTTAPSSGLSGIRLLQPYLSWAVASLLAISTLLFLSAAYGAYTSIRLVTRGESNRLVDLISKQNLADLDRKQDGAGPSQRNAAADSSSAAVTKQVMGVLSSGEMAHQIKKLGRAHEIYEEADGFVTWGLIVLGLALLFIALEIDIYVFVVAIAISAVILWRMPVLIENESSRFARVIFRKRTDKEENL